MVEWMGTSLARDLDIWGGMAPHGPHRMFVGNQLRDTCQGAFSGVETNPGVGALKSAGSWLAMAMGAELLFRLRRHQNARSSRFLSPFAASSVGYSSIFQEAASSTRSWEDEKFGKGSRGSAGERFTSARKSKGNRFQECM